MLVLDEPTNHLDLEAIHALAEALEAFEGTVIFVSHDRWFVSRLATRIVELTASGPRDFPGTYAEYLERCGDDHLDADAVASKSKRTSPGATAASAGAGAAGMAGAGGAAGGWEEQKRRRNRAAQLPRRRDQVLREIEIAEARKRAVMDNYADPGFYLRTGKEELAALEKEQAEMGPRLEALITEWEQLETEIATLAAGEE